MDFKYVVAIATFFVGVCAIYKDWIREKIGNRHDKLLVFFLVVSLIWSCYNIYDSNDKLKSEIFKKHKDSVDMDNKFKAVLTGLKTDTAELRKTNKLLGATKDTLSDKLAKNSIDIAGKISESGTKLLKNVTELNNQVTGGDGLVYFTWNINSITRNYNAHIVNTSKYRIEVLQMMVTDYNQLLQCKHLDSQGLYKIDRNCWFKNSKFLPDSLSSGAPIFISLGGQSIIDFPMPRIIGVHKYEISIILRNKAYLEQFVYRVNDNYSINQAIRLIEPIGKSYRVLKLFPSGEKTFNDLIDWDKFFSIPFSRLPYNLN